MCKVASDVVQMDTASTGPAAVPSPSLHRSPFYDGRTTYGGRAAYKHYAHASDRPFKVLPNTAVRIFEFSNRIEWLLQYSIRFETSTIIRNCRILTVTNFLVIYQNDADFSP